MPPAPWHSHTYVISSPLLELSDPSAQHPSAFLICSRLTTDCDAA